MAEKTPIDVGNLTETVIASAQRALTEREGASLFGRPPRIICGIIFEPTYEEEAGRV